MRKLIMPLALAAGASWLLAGPVAADDLTGAYVHGRAVSSTALCGTCSISNTVVSETEDGGQGASSASVEFVGEDVGYAAHAQIGDAAAGIDLGVYALGDYAPDALNNRAHEAYADADALQLFTYTGTQQATYTLSYYLEGSIQGGDETQVYGGITVFAGDYDPSSEGYTTLGEGFSGDAGADVGDGYAYSGLMGDCLLPGCDIEPFYLTGGVTFDVNPGDSFYLQAHLFATADSRFVEWLSTVDAAHTLGVGFTTGDTNLLVASVPGGAGASAAPEPAAWALMILGFGASGACFRARRRGERAAAA